MGRHGHLSSPLPTTHSKKRTYLFIKGQHQALDRSFYFFYTPQNEHQPRVLQEIHSNTYFPAFYKKRKKREFEIMSYTTRSSVVRRGGDWFDDFGFPSRIRDQHFGLGLSELDLDAPSSYYRGYFLRPQRQLSTGGTSEIKAESDKFQVGDYFLLISTGAVDK